MFRTNILRAVAQALAVGSTYGSFSEPAMGSVPKYRADYTMGSHNRLSQKGRRKRARWNN